MPDDDFYPIPPGNDDSARELESARCVVSGRRICRVQWSLTEPPRVRLEPWVLQLTGEDSLTVAHQASRTTPPTQNANPLN